MKMKIVDIIKKANIETVAQIIGGVIVAHTEGIPIEDAMKIEYPATLEFLQSEMEIDYKPTNADKIRSMNDKELAEFLVKFQNTFGEEYEGEMSCLDWLQSEAE